MMPAPGDTYAAIVEFFEADGVTPVDVPGLTFRASTQPDGTVLYGPSGANINHDDTGLYSFEYTVPTDSAPGQQLLYWQGSDGHAAQETIDISLPPVPTSPEVDQPCMDGSSGQQWNPDTSMVPQWDQVPADIQNFALTMATQVLWTLLGRRNNLCEVTVRPCLRQQLPTYLTFPSLFNAGAPSGGSWAWGLIGGPDGTELVFGGCGCVGGLCGCRRVAVPLPGPVSSIVAVTVHDEVLPASAYRLFGNELIRQDGHWWPRRQDYSTPLGNPHTWSVRYLRGVPVPAAANQVAGFYAGQLAKGMLGQPCQLPQRVQTITRQGVTAQMMVTQDYLDKGLTGVPLVDQYIRSQNPYGLSEAPKILSPDLPTYG